MKMTKWLYRGGSIFLIGVIVLSLWWLLKIHGIEFTRLRWVPLSDQQWGRAIGLIVEFSKEGIDQKLKIYRTNDGKSEDAIGNWTVNFLSHAEIALFGSFAKEKDRHLLYLLTAEGSRNINISKFKGSVTQVTENPLGTYLLIMGSSNNAINKAKKDFDIYGCVFDKNPESNKGCIEIFGGLLARKELNLDAQYSIYWNQEKDREIIIIEQTQDLKRGRVWTFDPWDKKVKIQNETYPDQFIQNKVVSHNRGTYFDDPGSNVKIRRWWRFMEMSFYFQGAGGKRSFTFLPKNVKIQWIDDNHMVLFGTQHVYILEVSSMKISELFKLSESSTHAITFFAPIKD